MRSAVIRSIILGAACLAAPALAQQGPTYSAEELARILQGGGGATPSDTAAAPGAAVFSADELARILVPAEGAAGGVRTRGLTAGTGVEPGSSGSGVVPDLRVNFELNSFELTADSKATLDELAKAMNMQQLSSLKFVIGGHTDASGSAGYNERLSAKRAASVVSYLEKRGVSDERLKAIGFGEGKLADPNNPNSGVNRRVEVRTGG